MNTDWHGLRGRRIWVWPLLIVLVLVLSAAVLVLVLETAHHDLVVEYRDHACRCFATPRFPLARFLGLASEADAWHCFAIQAPPAFSAVESQRDRWSSHFRREGEVPPEPQPTGVS